MNNNDIISLSDTASILGVSQATIRNWIKQNYLTPINKQSYFQYRDVLQIKKSISENSIERLNKRANKKNVTRTFIPEEYITNKCSIKQINTIVHYITYNNIDVNSALFILSIKSLIHQNRLPCQSLEEILDFKDQNSALFKILYHWYQSIPQFSLTNSLKFLFNMNVPEEPEFLGIIYQSLLQEGEKSKKGSYYTPANIIDDIVQDYAAPEKKILDPCCGSGHFLLRAAKIIQNPLHIYGYDNDPIAVFITKINLIQQFRQDQFGPNIFFNNTILHDQIQKNNFDLILTNPPWGSYFDNKQKNILKKKYQQTFSFESFSLFLSFAINHIHKNGIISFILPESILNVKTHQEIRSCINNFCHIIKINYLNKVFSNVFTPVIRLDLTKKGAKPLNTLIIKNNEHYSINQSRFSQNEYQIFDIHMTEKDYQIIKKIYDSDHYTLKNNADWALGIVTGNNKKHIQLTKQEGFEPVFTGKDIQPYFLGKAKSFIKFQPELYQQVPDEQFYRRDEKLIYRFISKKLVFAYDNEKRLTLNSANILIPLIKCYPIKVILALFNSTLFQYIYQKKFSSLKILRGHLEALPLPLWNTTTFQKIINTLENNSSNIAHQIIDQIIFNQFNLKSTEIKYIESLFTNGKK